MPYFDNLSFLSESLTARQSTGSLNLIGSVFGFIDINTVTAFTLRNSQNILIATMLHKKKFYLKNLMHCLMENRKRKPKWMSRVLGN